MTKNPTEQIILSQRDWKQFVQILDDESLPNAKLQKAVLKYKAGLLPIGQAARMADIPLPDMLTLVSGLPPCEGDIIGKGDGQQCP